MKATMSILGLYNYDDSLFNSMVLPDSVDKPTLIDNIVLECAELEILYPDLEFMKMIIGVWSRKELPTWERIAAAAAIEYDPIENYNRYEEEETAEDAQRSTESSTTAAGSSTDTSKDVHKVTGYNSNALVTQGQDDSTNNSQSSANTTGSAEETEGKTGNRNSHIHGNIGVTTSQQMLESELSIAPKLNVIDYITRSFKNRFCILVY